MSVLHRTTALLGCVSILAAAGCSERAADTQAEQPVAAIESSVEDNVAQLSVDTSPAPPVGGSCALDLVNGTLAAELSPVAGNVTLRGWVVDEAMAADGEAMLVLAGDGRHVATISRNIDRPDVAAAVGSEAARVSGFNQTIAVGGLAPGEYRVHLASGGVECDTGKRIAVGG